MHDLKVALQSYSLLTWNEPLPFPIAAVRHQTFLTLGAMARKMQQKDPAISESVVDLLHAMLSDHTGKFWALNDANFFVDWWI